MTDHRNPEEPMPPSTAPINQQLDWCARDVDRLHQVCLREVARDPRAQQPALLSALRDRLGCWPFPDTPPAEVLTYAGCPPWPLARVLATEEARPPPYQRAGLIAELRRRAAAAGPNATSVAPISHPSTPRGVFR